MLARLQTDSNRVGYDLPNSAVAPYGANVGTYTPKQTSVFRQ